VTAGFRRVPYRDDGYAVYAALPNIEQRLDDARRNARLADRQLTWLQDLRDKRAGQTEEQWRAEVAAYEGDRGRRA